MDKVENGRYASLGELVMLQGDDGGAVSLDRMEIASNGAITLILINVYHEWDEALAAMKSLHRRDTGQS